jgi:hypothetical protein
MAWAKLVWYIEKNEVEASKLADEEQVKGRTIDWQTFLLPQDHV